MKVCIIGDFSGQLDEAMRITAHNIAEFFNDREDDFLFLDIRNVVSLASLNRLKRYSPDILHYIPGPTILSFIILKFLSFYCGNVKTILSAYHPVLSIFSRQLIRFIKPNLVFYQSEYYNQLFQSLGCKTMFFPSGVDLNKFKPVSKFEKIELRKKYGLDQEKFIILHIGSIKTERNTELLNRLINHNQIVLIVGATSVGVNSKTYSDHMKSGCIVWSKYVENINEIYNLADCYIYPTLNIQDKWGRETTTSIQIPLTVLEAMACNIPVISSRFGGLPLIFSHDDGFYFAEKKTDFQDYIEKIKKNNFLLKNREKVALFSWDIIGQNLRKSYIDVFKEKL